MKQAFLIGLVVLLAGCGEAQNTITIARSDANLSLQTTGELASSDTQLVGPPMIKHGWQQKITFLIPEGTWVKQGQDILAFDDQSQREKLRSAMNELATEKQKLASQALDTEQNLEQLKLDIAEAKMKLTKAEQKAAQDGDYAARLAVKKLVIELEIAQKAYELSQYKQENKQQQAEVEKQILQAEVARLEAEVNNFKKDIAALKVKAPKDGIVVYVADNDGSKPAEGDQIFVVKKVIELPNLNQMIVKTTIPEQDISHIKVGQEVTIKIDAIPDKSFIGTVESLGQVVRVKSRLEASMVFDAVIRINDPDQALMRPGMAARLDIIQQTLNDVIKVPESGVHYGAQGAYVKLKSLFGTNVVPVEVLGRQKGEAFINGNLNTGSEVVL